MAKKHLKNALFMTILISAILGGGLVLLLSSCDSPMGLGPPVDLEPTKLRVLRIELADGTSIPIYEDGNKLFVGPGILVGAGAVLHGEAYDNESVVSISIEEIGDNAELIDGKPPNWSANVNARKNSGGWQEWSIGLEGLKKGERVISVTALDKPRNVGPDSVQQLTLLVDTDPPFVETIKIERRPGLQVDLLPRHTLMNFNPNIFDNIDYFQNESFIIRASILHDFSLSDVRLMLLTEEGKSIFPEALERTYGSVYTPEWVINHDLLVASNSSYAKGRHYFNVVISAKATAGHSGQNEDLENMFFSLCWFPESDIPRIQVPVDANGNILVERGEIIPITVFDDDNVGEVYAGLIGIAAWNEIPVFSDEAKLQYLIANHKSFPDELGNLILENNRINAPIPRTVISLNVDKNRGPYKLVALSKDSKTVWSGQSATLGVWGEKSNNVTIVEEGVPIIFINSPAENESPALTDSKNFKIEGSILNLDAVNLARIAWIPAGALNNLTLEQQMTATQEMLISNQPHSGVKIWPLLLENHKPEQIGSKMFIRQEFNISFDLFNDFKYNNVLENETKTFIIYTQGLGVEPVDVFMTRRLGRYDKRPVINHQPVNYQNYGSDEQIHFIIQPVSESGIPISSVTLFSYAKDGNIELTYHSSYTREDQTVVHNVWTGTDSHNVREQYRYLIKAVDALNNEAIKDLFIRIEIPPTLESITTSHNEETVFSSRDFVRVQAKFDRAVEKVDNVDYNPRIRLTGFTHGEYRYAIYKSGAGSDTLIFEYDVLSGDDTGTGFLQADAFLGRDGIPGVSIPPAPLSADITDPLKNRKLSIKGISPVITGIDVKRTEGKTNYNNQNFSWHREGEVITFDVTLDKEVRVMGSPRLLLPFNNQYATFQTTTNTDKTMRFTYKVQNNDLYDLQNLLITANSCFSADHLAVITDKVGAQGNFLALTGTPAQTSNVRVDSVKPVAPRIQSTHSDGFGTALTPRPEDPLNSHRFIVMTDLIETHPGTVVQYTINGANWLPLVNYDFVLSEATKYDVSVRQVDRAGNVGDPFPFISFSLSGNSELVSIICDNPDGAYNDNGGLLSFKLIFSGPISSTGAGSVSLSVGTGPNTAAITRTLPAVNHSQANPVFALSFSWTIDANRRIDPVSINSINLAGVKRESGSSSLFTSDSDYIAKMETVAASFNANRKGVEVLSVKPRIIDGTHIDHKVVSNNTITLKFDTVVYPENGYIRIKPTATGNNGGGTTTNGEWLVPPVLTNDEFTKVKDALSSTSSRNITDNTRASYYIKNTHGIKSNGTAYVPDTDTKYVLNFSSGLNNATIRPLLNEAKHLWQEIEVVSSKVTGGGTDTITVALDTLPPGRQWKIEIDARTFRDRASNYFEGWGTENSSYWFWSEKTAAPVIRVNRVSNNSPRLAIAYRTNVEYRIDCVTPGAAITYGEWNRSASSPSNTSTDINVLRGVGGGIARITTGAMPGQGDDDPYRANDSAGNQNSIIADASVSDITTDLNSRITNAYTTGTIRTIGDTDLYTARKDYIGARATRTANLSDSDRSYEGAFKTLVVYRGVGAQVEANAGRSLKIEATNLRNGAVTIAGFPMWYNDMTGAGSKYMLRNGDSANNDWIFITWEIVSEFWHVTPVTRDDPNLTPLPIGVLWNSGDTSNSWQSFSANYQVHNYRTYGNWGMQRGNR